MRASPDYRRYLINPPDADVWGIAVTGCGRQTCAAGTTYPPAGHPPDHHFNWDNGRVLGSCQIIFISRGTGVFDSRATGLVQVSAGTAMVVIPGVWHRYAPDPKTGWLEHWIELQGATPQSLVRKGLLSPERAVVAIDRTIKLESLMDEIQGLSSEAGAGFVPETAALGMHILSLVVAAQRSREPARPITSFVARAEEILMNSVDKPPAIPGLARELGVAYSYFRREFKRHTGLAPYQYARQLRLEKARRMIGGSSQNLQSIADQLGFASSYHLSAAFKKQYGQSPDHWRRRRS
jgi:AraC-like DNA-binding protein